MTKSKEPKPPRRDRAGPSAPTNPTTGSFQVSDALWEVLAPLLPQRVNTHPLGGGRPRVPDRTCANGIFYVLRTGCQWKALDATGICSGSTSHLRFQEWAAAGVFLGLWQVGLERYDELQGLDWSWLSMDGAITKSPLGGGLTGVCIEFQAGARQWISRPGLGSGHGSGSSHTRLQSLPRCINRLSQPMPWRTRLTVRPGLLLLSR